MASRIFVGLRRSDNMNSDPETKGCKTLWDYYSYKHKVLFEGVNPIIIAKGNRIEGIEAKE